MPNVSKFADFDIEAYELDLRDGISTRQLPSMNGVRASFDSPGSAMSQITLYDVQLEPGLAVFDYNEQAKKANLVYIKGRDGVLESPAEVSAFYGKGLGQKLAPLIFQNGRARIFIVSSIVMYDGSRLVKLGLTDSFIGLQ
jgi:hypothetical protein